MKKTTLLLLCLMSINIVQSQQKAVTGNGEEVILYDNGTWEYQNIEDQKANEIPVNSKKFKKEKESTFLVKSNKINVGFWVNPKKWTFSKALTNDEAEYEFELKGEDLYGLAITEKLEIPLKTLKSIALENGREAAPDLKVVNEEYRTVNGLKVLFLQMNGTMQGIKFSYYGYYFSNENGTVQFVAFTSQNLLDSYVPEIEKLLNGLVELD